MLKLFYALIFTAVVERVYVKCAITTLSGMVEPVSVDRSEQFTLSLLIHYPQYMLWGVMAAICVLIAVNLLVCSWLWLSRYLYRKLNQADSTPGLAMHTVEGAHD
ncbi:UNVERIFIED_ORG: H+/Cl- antiporter ClcA [Pantoea agglomerans]